MRPLQVRLIVDPVITPHLSQLYTGFGSLHRQGLIRAELRRGERSRRVRPTRQLTAVLGGRIRVIYDTADGAAIDDEEVANTDLYFKRGFASDYVAALAEPVKVHPLGLNYGVYSSRDWGVRRTVWSLAALRRGNGRIVARNVAALNGPLSALSQVPYGRSACRVQAFEAPPVARDPPTALLLTRTWDPIDARDDEVTAQNFQIVNRMRAQCVRDLRRELGPAFVGGLAPTDHARRTYPDCVVDGKLTEKKNYLRAMKRCDVCVASLGLHGSNGWRLGEYVAASRAIVAETLVHDVPGQFTPFENYLPFVTADECVAHTVNLLTDAKAREAMMRRNAAYYQSHVRPDALVWQTIRAAKDLLDS